MIDGITRVKNMIMENGGVGITAYFLDKEAVDIAVKALLELGFDPIPLTNNDWVFSPLTNEEYMLAIEKLRLLGFEPVENINNDARIYDDIFIFSI